MVKDIHTAVLAEEAVSLLDVKPGAVVVDVTAGAGGHLSRFVQAVGEGGRVIGLDRDDRAFAPDAAGGVAAAHPEVVTLVRAPFSEVRRVLDELGLDGVDALLADIGVSSMQLDEGARGFSFQADAPLDMRMDRSTGLTAAEFIDVTGESDLADVLFQLGEERASRRIAKAIKRGPVPSTTLELAERVASVLPRRGRLHPATRTFQALRIAVNGELDQLDALLQAIPDVLKVGGRAAVISFHSLEDRRVKHSFRDMGRKGAGPLRVLTKKPVVAGDEERRLNPRSRSAKLRVVERLS